MFLNPVCLIKSSCRLKAGLKLTEEATKEEVQQSIHLVQDTSGSLCHSWHFIIFLTGVIVAAKAKLAQKARQASKVVSEEMETES